MRLSRTTGAGAGLAVLLLGLWAGIIPFVGPYFHYGFQPDSSWHFTTNRLWLDILPAAAAVLGGLAMIATARRANGVLSCWLALAGGLWLLLGPSVSLFWQHPAAGTLISGVGAPIGGHDRAAVEMIGFFYGAGALIAALSAFAAARFVHRPALVADPLAAEAAAGGVRAGYGGGPAGERGAPVGARGQQADGPQPAAGQAPGDRSTATDAESAREHIPGGAPVAGSGGAHGEAPPEREPGVGRPGY